MGLWGKKLLQVSKGCGKVGRLNKMVWAEEICEFVNAMEWD